MVNARNLIIHSVFKLETIKGHLRWSVTDVAKKSKTSRSLIYYHFGSSKEKILINALMIVCEDYFGLTPKRMELAKNDFFQSALITKKMFFTTPEFAIFYQLWRSRISIYQNLLKDYEYKYQKKLQLIFPNLTHQEVEKIHALLHGAMTAPFLSDDVFKEVLHEIMQKINEYSSQKN